MITASSAQGAMSVLKSRRPNASAQRWATSITSPVSDGAAGVALDVTIAMATMSLRTAFSLSQRRGCSGGAVFSPGLGHITDKGYLMSRISRREALGLTSVLAVPALALGATKTGHRSEDCDLVLLNGHVLTMDDHMAISQFYPERRVGKGPG